MKVNVMKCLVPTALLGTLLLPLAAQAQTPYHHGVGERLHDQQGRIAQGVRSGQLTPREASRLERRETFLHRQDYRMHLSGGRFTPEERRRLEREENHTSHAIYHQKHDAQHGY